MALNIKNEEVEQLASGVAQLAGETKTEAIRQALVERFERLRARSGGARRGLRVHLEANVWPLLAPGDLGRTISREEEDRILGYGAC